MFEYFANNYVWNLSVNIALESGAQIGEIDEMCRPLREAAARAQCDFLVLSIHWGIEYAPAPRPEDTELAHTLMEAGASVLVGHHPHVLQPVETYLTQDNRTTVIFYSLGNFLSNQSRSYIDGVMPDKDGEPRESLIVRFAAVQKDYGPAGKRVELGSVGLWPAWQENNRNDVQRGKDRTPFIHPVLIDRAIAPAATEVEALEKKTPEQKGPGLTPEEKQQYIEASTRLKTLQHQRELILARTGDEYVVDPQKVDPPKIASPKAVIREMTGPPSAETWIVTGHRPAVPTAGGEPAANFPVGFVRSRRARVGAACRIMLWNAAVRSSAGSPAANARGNRSRCSPYWCRRSRS